MSKSKTTIAQVTEWFLQFLARNPIMPSMHGITTITVECYLCRAPLRHSQRIQWDHVHPEGLDGPHEIGNLRPVHYDCHKKKSGDDVKAMAKAYRSNGTTGTRGDKFTPKKLPLDAPRPEKPRFGQSKRFFRS